MTREKPRKMKAALFCLRTAAGESAGGEYGERGGREKAADLPSANSVFFSRTNTEEGPPPSKTATEQKIGKGGIWPLTDAPFL